MLYNILLMRNWEGVQQHRAIRQTFPGAGRAQLNLFTGLRNSTCTTATPRKKRTQSDTMPIFLCISTATRQPALADNHCMLIFFGPRMPRPYFIALSIQVGARKSKPLLLLSYMLFRFKPSAYDEMSF